MRARSAWRVRVTDWRNSREASSVPPLSSRASTACVCASPGRTISWLAAKISAVAAGSPRLLEEKVDIGPKHAGERRRQVARVGLRVDDFAEHRLGGRPLAGPREIAGEAALGVEQGGRARVIGLEQRHALPIERVGLRHVSLRLRRWRRDRRGSARASMSPMRRGRCGPPGAWNRPAGARAAACGEIAAQPERRSAQLQRLAVEDHRFFGRSEFVGLRIELLAELGFGVEALRGDGAR